MMSALSTSSSATSPSGPEAGQDSPPERSDDAGAASSVPARLPDGRLPSLTGMRWGAALLVFLFHVRNLGYFTGHGGQLVNWGFGHGDIGVSFFFVLSGFVLAWTARRGDTATSFWRRRVARIYPLHLSTALIAFLLGLVLVPALHQESRRAAVANLFLVNAWKNEWWQALDPVSWSLSCEAFFYASFPLLWFVLRRLGPRALVGVALVAFGCTLLLARADAHHALPFFANVFPAARWPEFVVGVVVARLVREGWWRGPGLDVSVAVTVVGYFLAQQVPHSYAIAAVTLPGFALVIAAAATADLSGERSVWRHPVLVRLGEWSFAFYLLHILVMRTGEQVVGASPRFTWLPGLAWTSVVFGVTLALSALLYTVVEVPGRRLLLRRRRAATSSGS